jgi:hypothetical protein
MTINKDFFCDELMRAEFDNDSSIGLTFFYDFFMELLSQFEKSSSGKPVYEIIQNDWNLFVNMEKAQTIIQSILPPGLLGYEFNDLVDYSTDIKNKVASWARLKEDVRRQRRFLADYDEFSQYAYLTAEAELKKGDRLYRARILPNQVAKYKKKEMGCPPPELATAGRANPAGISDLYLRVDEKTTYYEVRASYLDRLSIGTFKVERDLRIVDFDTKVSLYFAYTDGEDLTSAIVGKLILDEISRDMSRPMRRFDSEQEYIPTQMICEYCKLIVGADGVSFKSSVYDSGRNYVLFDKDNAKCTKVVNREIKSVSIGV